jgi:hypothetical protein
MSNPFSQFKPYTKDATSTWPLFSDWLDDTLDLGTAPQQYAIYASWIIGFGWIAFTSARYRKLSKLVPDSVISDMNKHQLLDRLKGQRAKGIAFPLITTFIISGLASVRRNEEVDRSGDRFHEYYTRASYSGLDQASSVALARDIVLASSTHVEGSYLLENALRRLQEKGAINVPKYDADGMYKLPDNIVKQQMLKELDDGNVPQQVVFVPGKNQPLVDTVNV